MPKTFLILLFLGYFSLHPNIWSFRGLVGSKMWGTVEKIWGVKETEIHLKCCDDRVEVAF